MPNFQFAMEVWTQVSFPVAKLLPVKLSADVKPSEFAWICLGTDGEVALFRGQDRVKQWDAASFSSTYDAELGLPVDLAMVSDHGTSAKGAIVFPDRIHVFSIEL
ncbi:unnamed protein product [Phytophthora fragariaefolia]|uniref:Unnamed protein product n=1 Tax=Phytophthora fragariaefolia TaxID=1490495 RepID=A0A9W6XUF5_9STRA|nr:unnamed protein product [Phytophthora fragariaefolia]